MNGQEDEIGCSMAAAAEEVDASGHAPRPRFHFGELQLQMRSFSAITIDDCHVPILDEISLVCLLPSLT
jgi:hypothetical protein